jgi:hypothetical protein
MGQYISRLQTSGKLMIQLGGTFFSATEFGVILKLVKWIWTYLNEVHTEVHIGERLSDTFSVQNSVK